MKKYQFLQHQQQIVNQLKTNIKSIEDITYDDYEILHNQAIQEGHEQPDVVAFIGLFSNIVTIDLQLFAIE
jgi:hypothetical protein